MADKAQPAGHALVPVTPRVSVRALARAALRELVNKTPGVGSLVKIVREAEDDTQQFRIAYWCRELAGESSVDEVSARLEAALGGEDGDAVRAAVRESARAAIDAIDDAVIPSIARLTKRYLETKSPDPRRYRELLELLTSLQRDEFEALRDALPIIDDVAKETQAAVATKMLAEDDGWVWYATWTGAPPEGGVSREFRERLGKGEGAAGAAAALTGQARSMFGDLKRVTPRFQLGMIELLRAIIG